MAALAEEIGRQPCSLQRELAMLTDAGILRRAVDRNRVYYQANESCPVYHELQALFEKSPQGQLIGSLRNALEPLSEAINVAFVFGSEADGTANEDSDLDLFIVGFVTARQLAKPLNQFEKNVDRSIDLFLRTPEELRKRLASGDHFVRSVVDGDKVFVVGNEDALANTLGQRQTRRTPYNAGRNR